MEREWHPASGAYRKAVEAERHIYSECSEVHNLPPIFHYWSNKYIRAALRETGFDSVGDFFAANLASQCTGVARFASLGSGNCDFEIDLARRLIAAGHSNFTIECIDLNRAMLDRGSNNAAVLGVASHFCFIQEDLNTWTADHRYNAVIANQSLHHIVNLEGLFTQVQQSLRDDGVFILSDMVGRNGHRRWPEALERMQSLWRLLPPSYRVNRRFGYFQETFEDWDCSGEGFEGVRAQDILPLLNERFSFRFFFPYGNLIDAFVDRAFGFNFDPQSPEDCAFIDYVHQLDEMGLESGQLTPTHLFAVVGKSPALDPVCRKGLVPSKCVWRADAPPCAPDIGVTPPGFSVDPARELDRFRFRMAEAREVIRGRMDWAFAKERELAEITGWALQLDAGLDSKSDELSRLQNEFDARTEWALNLDAELTRANAEIARLQNELQQRTAWALTLRDEEAVASARIENLSAQLGEHPKRERSRVSQWIDRVAARTLRALRV